MKVNAIIIGAGRSGTTTLYKYLENHPDVCFSYIKEVHYFSVDDLYKRGENYYHSFWKHCNDRKIKIAADTYLLIDKKAPQRIAKYNSETKIIIILRNPVERAWSSYLYAVNSGYIKENISFIQSIKNEDNYKDADIAVQNNLCNIRQSMYFKHISYWFESFPRKNFLILKTADLKEQPEILLKKLSDFLDITEFKTKNTSIKANKSAKVKSKILQQFMLNRNNPARKFLRKVLPESIKQKILHSKLPDKISSANRKETVYTEISEENRRFAEKLLQKDTERLEKILGIKF